MDCWRSCFLGALTHEAMSLLTPVRQAAGGAGFVTRFRTVQGAGYASAVCVLWIVTFIFGAWIYTKYRIYIRIPIEQQGFWEDTGLLRDEGTPRHHRALGCCRSVRGTSWKNSRNSEYNSPRNG